MHKKIKPADKGLYIIAVLFASFLCVSELFIYYKSGNITLLGMFQILIAIIILFFAVSGIYQDLK